MNEIKVFNNPTFGNIRTTGTPDNPLFCLADVAKVLELTPSKVVQRLSKDVLSKYPLETDGGTQMANFVNEDGLYDVILDSRKPEAKIFRKWVTSEVLPSIRKTGQYGNYPVPQTFSQALMLAAQQQEQIEAQKLLIAERDKKIAQDAPKVVFSDAVVGSQSSCLIGELAKLLTQNGYEIGQNRLFEKLRKDGFLGKSGEYYNIPNQKYVEQGLFELKKTTHSENGVMKSSVTPKVTGKGQQYFINKYLKGVNVFDFKD
jgi:prophage antirepressor-like protein